jgi:hypothetical protein
MAYKSRFLLREVFIMIITEEIRKHLKSYQVLVLAEMAIIDGGKIIEGSEMEKAVSKIMEEYTYGWYICDQDVFEQLKSINKFKAYILIQISYLKYESEKED